MTKAWKKPFLIFLLADILLFTSCTVYSSNCRDLAKLDSLDVKNQQNYFVVLWAPLISKKQKTKQVARSRDDSYYIFFASRQSSFVAVIFARLTSQSLFGSYHTATI